MLFLEAGLDKARMANIVQDLVERLEKGSAAGSAVVAKTAELEGGHLEPTVDLSIHRDPEMDLAPAVALLEAGLGCAAAVAPVGAADTVVAVARRSVAAGFLAAEKGIAAAMPVAQSDRWRLLASPELLFHAMLHPICSDSVLADSVKTPEPDSTWAPELDYR